jgi:hypothetical protein
MKKLWLLLIPVLGAAGFFAYWLKQRNHVEQFEILEYPEGLSNTEGMLAILDIKRNEFQDFRNFYANTVQYDRLNAQKPPEDFEKHLEWDFKRSEQALNAGKVDEAIAIAKGAIQRMDAEQYEGKMNHKLLHQLGICYFRMGELQNCLTNHNAESCILPFSDNAVHKMQDGSKNAVEVYTRILNENPKDYHAQYLLNLAYITLGEYPEAVPQKWVIDPAKLSKGSDLPRFKNIAGMLGVDCFSTSGSANVDDFNGDGYLDIFCSGFGLTEQARLFFADGKGHYTDVSEQAGLKGLPGGLNTTHCDYDNDGDRDLFILRGGWWNRFGHVPNSLLRNNGDGTFTDVTKEAGILSFYPTQTATWADYDSDGWLDVFIGNESSKFTKNNPCELYRNNGDGTFTNVARQAGIKAKGYIKGVNAGDYDNDGLPDVYISIYHGDNVLLHNTTKKGGPIQFQDVTATAGVAKPKDSFPVWWFDYDNDGRLDLCVLSFSNSPLLNAAVSREFIDGQLDFETSRFYWNKGDGTFEDRTELMGMNTMIMAMGSNYGDLNGDGWHDIFVGVGNPDLSALFPNRMFLNQEGKRYEDVTMDGAFGHLQKGHAIVFADLDNDGDQDVYANMGGAIESDYFQNALFENPGFGNHWLTLRLIGKDSNRDGIGSRIHLVVKQPDGSTRDLYRYVSGGPSFGGSSIQEEIGLNQADSILEAEVFWPKTGKTQRFKGLPKDNIISITEGSDSYNIESYPAFVFGGMTDPLDSLGVEMPAEMHEQMMHDHQQMNH